MSEPTQARSLVKTTYYQQLSEQTLDHLEAQAPVEWQVGDVILDLYEITAMLGEGGMGKVFRAHHRGWNMDLAVKCPKPELFTSEKGKQDYIQEAETWINLGLHPHIASCYYVRNLGGAPRLFAECVEGGSLESWIETRRLYGGGKGKALERILDIAIQFAWGLQYAHEMGLVHQDVKPHNVLMTPDGIAKVTDFGLSKARVEAGAGAGTAGSPLVSAGGYTPAYCSPEQAEGKKLDKRTDIWSWAVSILEMFTGEVAWISGVVAASALENYLDYGVEAGGIPAMPAMLLELVRECLQDNPLTRPENMSTIANLLISIYQEEFKQAYRRQIPDITELRSDSLNNKALTMLDLGKSDVAEDAWQEALRTDPAHLETVYNLSLQQWRRSLITDEVPLSRLREAVGGASREDWLVAYMAAQVHLERGDCINAIKMLEVLGEEDQSREYVVDTMEKAYNYLPFSRRHLEKFEGHTGMVLSVSLSADGRLALSSAGWDKVLRLWDVKDGSYLRRFRLDSTASSVCLSADGRYALTGSWDNTLCLWDVDSSKKVRTFKKHEKTITSVSLSADGRFALSGSDDKTLRLWEVESGRCMRILRGHTARVTSVCLSIDGRFALSGSKDNTLRFWDTKSGKCLCTLEGHEGYVNSVCLSADGQFALSGSEDETIRLWDLREGKCLRTFLGHEDSVTSIDLSEDDRYALSGSDDRTLRLWEVKSGRCLHTFTGHGASINSVSLSADGRLALSGSGGVGYQKGLDDSVRLWEAASDWIYTAPPVFCQPRSGEKQLTISQEYMQGIDEAKNAIAEGDLCEALRCLREVRSLTGYERAAEGIQLWAALYTYFPRSNLVGAWHVRTFEGHLADVNSVCMSSDGRFALSGGGGYGGLDNTLRLWDVESGRCLRIFEGHVSNVISVSMSADGRYALSSDNWERKLRLWDISNGKCLRIIEGHKAKANSVFLSADGRFALAGEGKYQHQDNVLRLWDIERSRCLRTFKGHEHAVRSVCMSTDGRLALSGSEDKTMRLWELKNGRCLHTFIGHEDSVTSVCMSADGRYALSGSSDGSLRLWDISNGVCLHTYKGHAGGITSVCLTADGRFGLSGSWDKTLRLWDLGNGNCLRTFEGHTDMVRSVSMSADGRFALSAGGEKNLHLWFLDWELEEKEPAGWDEEARPYLENFLNQHSLGANIFGKWKGSEWTEEDFQQLLYTLGYAGYGWLREEGVRRKLEEMLEEM